MIWHRSLTWAFITALVVGSVIAWLMRGHRQNESLPVSPVPVGNYELSFYADEKPSALTLKVSNTTVEAVIPQTAIPKVEPRLDPVVVELESLTTWTESGYANNDPRFDRPVKTVRGHLAQALEYLKITPHSVYPTSAIQRVIALAVGPSDQEVVLAALNTAPFLIDSVVAHHWSVAAHATLLTRLNDQEKSLPPHALTWALALAAAHDVQDYPVLMRTLVRMNNGNEQAELVAAMQELPNADWQSAVRLAWGARSGYTDHQHGLVELAASIGIKDAFMASIIALTDSKLSPKGKSSLRTWLLTQPVVDGKIPDAAWLSAKQDYVIFSDHAWRMVTLVDVPKVMTPITLSAPTTPANSSRLPPAQPDPVVAEPPPGLSITTDAAAVKKWIDSTLTGMTPREKLTRNDPLIEDLAHIPPQHWSVLLESRSRYRREFIPCNLIEYALLRSVRFEHQQAVIAALPDHPFLISAILTKGWIPAAAPTIRRLLVSPSEAARNQLEATTQFVRALALLGEARDHQVLSETLSRMRYGYWQADMAKNLADMPGFDYEAAVRFAWRRFSKADYGDGQNGFAVAAARAGIIEALDITIVYASDGDTGWKSGKLSDEARQFIATTFSIEPQANTIASWWPTAKQQVRWDALKHRWLGPHANPEKPAPNF